MTKFETYGYTKHTIFRVLNPVKSAFRKGDEVKLATDDGTDIVFFAEVDGSKQGWLPLHCVEPITPVEDALIAVKLKPVNDSDEVLVDSLAIASAYKITCPALILALNALLTVSHAEDQDSHKRNIICLIGRSLTL